MNELIEAHDQPFDFKAFEEKLCESIEDIFEWIVSRNPYLNISARSRAGAEISGYLEDKFVDYIQTNGHPLIHHPGKSPKGATKNPFDARFSFEYLNRKEEVWIDFKSFKVSSSDSNPDIGTINKVIRFIREGNYYIVFVLVFYAEFAQGLKFEQRNDKYTKVYLLKDVNKSVRLNPKKQLQVNISAEPEYRTRAAFIELLRQKQRESLVRVIQKSQHELEILDQVYDGVKVSNRKAEVYL